MRHRTQNTQHRTWSRHLFRPFEAFQEVFRMRQRGPWNTHRMQRACLIHARWRRLPAPRCNHVPKAQAPKRHCKGLMRFDHLHGRRVRPSHTATCPRPAGEASPAAHSWRALDGEDGLYHPACQRRALGAIQKYELRASARGLGRAGEIPSPVGEPIKTCRPRPFLMASRVRVMKAT